MTSPLESLSSRIESDPPDSDGSLAKTFLDVSYQDKNTAKALGAKWDRQEESWVVPPGVDPAPLSRWIQDALPSLQMPRHEINPAGTANAPPSRHYLAVPYGDRETAKAAGALWDKVVKSRYAGPQADAARLQPGVVAWIMVRTNEPLPVNLRKLWPCGGRSWAVRCSTCG